MYAYGNSEIFEEVIILLLDFPTFAYIYTGTQQNTLL